MRWLGLVALMGASIVVYRALLGKPEGKRLLGRPKHRWKGNVKTDLQKVVLGAWTRVIWIRIGTRGGLL